MTVEEKTKDGVRIIRLVRRPDIKSTVHVTPQCCKEVEISAAVFLEIDIYSDEEHQKPQWVTRSWCEQYRCTDTKPAKFCPHCGKPVPKIIPSKIKERICKVTDGGYYCESCKKRLSECRCLPPEFAWKPEGVII